MHVAFKGSQMSSTISDTLKKQIIRDYIATAASRSELRMKHLQPLRLRYCGNPRSEIWINTVAKAFPDISHEESFFDIVLSVHDEYCKILDKIRRVNRLSI